MKIVKVDDVIAWNMILFDCQLQFGNQPAASPWQRGHHDGANPISHWIAGEDEDGSVTRGAANHNSPVRIGPVTPLFSWAPIGYLGQMAPQRIPQQCRPVHSESLRPPFGGDDIRAVRPETHHCHSCAVRRQTSSRRSQLGSNWCALRPRVFDEVAEVLVSRVCRGAGLAVGPDVHDAVGSRRCERVSQCHNLFELRYIGGSDWPRQPR